MFLVNDLMSTQLVTLDEQEPLDDVRRWLSLAHLHHLPVVRGRTLVGLLTHRELLAQAARQRDGEAPARAGEVMKKKVMTVRPGSSAQEAVRLLLRYRLGCLPVVESDRTLVGLLTATDLLKVAAERVGAGPLDGEADAAEG
ncbi:MAG: CBS domain-containing protein [Myxococcaceae bacterium]|nr:CBS domain-containing protein [Myxococcaceae bacterium]